MNWSIRFAAGNGTGQLQGSSGSHELLDRVAGQSVEEHGKKENEEEPQEDLDDGPLVVVPYNVAN